MAVGVLGAGIPASIALVTRGPGAELLVFPAVGLVFGLGVYLFHSARRLTPEQRLDAVVIYPSWSLPRPTSDRQRTALWVILVGLVMFAAGRAVALLAGASGWTPWTTLAVDLGLAAMVATVLRRPPASQGDAAAEPID